MIGAVVSRLEAVAPVLTAVQVAEDIEALSKGVSAASGTAFVVPYRERAGANTLASGGHRQLVEVQIVVALLIRHQDDARGAARAAQFDGYKAAIEAALAGWEPGSGCEPFALVGGEPTSLGNNATIYAQTWQTSRFLTGA